MKPDDSSFNDSSVLSSIIIMIARWLQACDCLFSTVPPPLFFLFLHPSGQLSTQGADLRPEGTEHRIVGHRPPGGAAVLSTDPTKPPPWW